MKSSKDLDKRIRAMSREIKFRAWDKTARTFDFVSLSDNGWSHQDTDLEGHELSEWQQYTGLKDRNGVEIYEGDVVDCERHGFTTSIEYYGGAFRCRSEGMPLSLYIDECYADKDNNNQLEVIGNIYENSELLTNKGANDETK